MIILIEALKASVLGIIEGFTEFLPISSTGHLILVNQFISFDKEFNLMFDIVIQLGAVLAVVALFFKRLWPFTKDLGKNKEIWNIWFKTLVGVLPAIIVGALFASKIEEKLFNIWTVAVTLIVGGIIIIFVERRNKQPIITDVKNLTFKTAFFIGIIQCLSMIPGTSRSGATIIGAMILGASRVVATEFSFFLAIPTMVAASTWSLLKYGSILDINQLIVLGAGFIVSFLVAMAFVKFLVYYIQQNDFKLFGHYRIVLGLIIILVYLFNLPK